MMKKIDEKFGDYELFQLDGAEGDRPIFLKVIYSHYGPYIETYLDDPRPADNLAWFDNQIQFIYDAGTLRMRVWEQGEFERHDTEDLDFSTETIIMEGLPNE